MITQKHKLAKIVLGCDVLGYLQLFRNGDKLAFATSC